MADSVRTFTLVAPPTPLPSISLCSYDIAIATLEVKVSNPCQHIDVT